MLRRARVPLVLLTVAFIVAAALWYRARASDIITVDVGSAERRELFQSFVTASGEIVATRFADVGSSVMGKVVRLSVREGDQVRAGASLARIDPVQAQSDRDAAYAEIDVLRAEEAAARDQVAVARSNFDEASARATESAATRERAIALHGAGLLPAADEGSAVAAADAADAEVRASKAAITRAEQSLAAARHRVTQAVALATGARDVLDRTEITAPIDGVVSRLGVREGEMVVVGIQNQPGTILMTISDLSAVDAEVKVAEADVLRLRVEQTASVTLDAMPGTTFVGHIVEIGTSALPVQGPGAAAREFRVVIRLADGRGLRPGMTCDAEILADERRDTVSVPLQAVVIRSVSIEKSEQTGVFVLDRDVAVFHPVKTGIIGGLAMEIVGLEPGTSIVTGPFQTLRELQSGDRVRASSRR